jgi:hypothetical protein
MFGMIQFARALEFHKTLLAYNVGNGAMLAQRYSVGANPPLTI